MNIVHEYSNPSVTKFKWHKWIYTFKINEWPEKNESRFENKTNEMDG